MAGQLGGRLRTMKGTEFIRIKFVPRVIVYILNIDKRPFDRTVMMKWCMDHRIRQGRGHRVSNYNDRSSLLLVKVIGTVRRLCASV